MSPQNRFWNSLYELVFHGYLLQQHCQEAAKTDRRVKAVLAVTSTTSLGIWAVLKAYSEVWASIIVITQIITATSKYLPFSARLKAAAGCAHDYREIQNWAEARWCDILDGELTDTQVNKGRLELQTKIARALKTHFPMDGLPSNEVLTKLATDQAEQYLQAHYGVDENDESRTEVASKHTAFGTRAR